MESETYKNTPAQFSLLTPEFQYIYLFMQGLKFVLICILIFKFYIVHNIASHDAIFCRQFGASVNTPSEHYIL